MKKKSNIICEKKEQNNRVLTTGESYCVVCIDKARRKNNKEIASKNNNQFSLVETVLVNNSINEETKLIQSNDQNIGINTGICSLAIEDFDSFDKRQNTIKENLFDKD